ncbi:hypothetical protein G3M48_000169 [Beauveria asiatica]|uniref:Uncharacterized protein n=1 Tax=Beauveria asiatica TaxID=1069075 RepID=A0AAW0RHF6_9HYPO
MLLDVINNDDADDTVDSATYARRRHLDTQQLTLQRNPVIRAVQGPQYAASGYFLRDAHLDDDPAAPLLTQYMRLGVETALAAAARAGASGRGRCDGAADMTEHALNHRFRHIRAQTEVILKGRKANLDVKNLTTDESSLPKTVGAVDKKRPWLGGESVRM